MMKLRLAAFLLFGLASGCSSTSNGVTPSTSTALPFKPSNVDLTGWDLSQVGDVDLSGTNCILDSEQPEGLVALLCDSPFTNKVVHKIITLPDQSRLSIFVMKSLRVEASTVFSVSRGPYPVVIVALGSVELLGSIEVAPGTTGGAVDSAKYAKGAGTGGGAGGDSTGLAGGGASFCGVGGKAGTSTPSGTAPPPPTSTYGTPELVPLVAGSAGGSGALIDDIASGGGALQIVAGVSFALHVGAHVSAGGGGGAFGGLGIDGAGGGGSGGAILIESPTVKIDGVVAANGGGGGQGNGDSGEAGRPDVVAQGGHKTGIPGMPGGSGSFASTMNGGDGPSSSTTSAGGGGGGAGRIRINTTNAQAAITGAASPAVASACLTQGSLAK